MRCHGGGTGDEPDALPELERALAGLRAALTQRGSTDETPDEGEADASRRTWRPLPVGRTVSGLSEAELRKLADSVDRLLEPLSDREPAEGKISGTKDRSLWRRLRHPRCRS